MNITQLKETLNLANKNLNHILKSLNELNPDIDTVRKGKPLTYSFFEEVEKSLERKIYVHLQDSKSISINLTMDNKHGFDQFIIHISRRSFIVHLVVTENCYVSILDQSSTITFHTPQRSSLRDEMKEWVQKKNFDLPYDILDWTDDNLLMLRLTLD